MPPVPAPEESFRRRLEGRAEVLEAAAPRYRALLDAVTAFRWRHRLETAPELLREVVRAQQTVEEALAVAQRRAAAEDWPKSSPVVTCVLEVARLRRELLGAVQRRLKANAGLPLADALERLERRLVTEPRLVLPGDRWAVAIEVVPPSLPELQGAVPLGVLAARLFAGGTAAGAALPSPDELDALERAWGPGTAALAAVWRRLEGVDVTGSLARFVRTKRPSAAAGLPPGGPERLLYVERWVNTARARLDGALEQSVGPVRCREPERFAVLRWLSAQRTDAGARLATSGEVTDGRAGLLELAFALSHGKARLAGDWGPLLERARRADGARGDDDWVRLRGTLELLTTVMRAPSRVPHSPLSRSQRGGRPPRPTWRPPSATPPDTLEALVEELRRLAENAAP